MKSSARILTLLGVALSLALASSTARAAEPTVQFLEQLVANGYYDEAMAYLEQMSTSNLPTQEFKESILYRQGTVLIQASRMDRDPSIRQRRLADAQSKLNEFVQQFPQHPSVSAATEELAKISVENARILVQSARKQTGSQQQESFAQARTKFDEAIAVYESRLAQIRSELEGMPKQLDPVTQADLIERKDLLQDDYLRAMLTVPMLMFEKADTFSDDDENRIPAFEAASEKFDEMASKYRRYAAGLTARLWSGRSRFELGQYPEALTDFGDILDLPNDDPFLRGLRAHALHYSLQIWVNEDQKEYNEAITKAGEMVESIREQEESDMHWLGVRYFLALASVLETKENTELTGAEKNALLAQAKRNAEAVVAQESPYKDMAQRLLAELSGEAPEEDEDESEDIEPTTFVEAKQFGDDATRAMQDAQRDVKIYQAGPADPGDTERAAEMQELLVEAEQEVIERRARAFHCYQKAIELANAETPMVELNQVRFLLAHYLFWAERYWESALLSDYYTRHCAGDNKGSALKAATIALQSYQQLYYRARQQAIEDAGGERDPDAEPTPNEQFAVAQVLDMADYVAVNFENEPEAQQALITLIRFLVQQGDLEQATEYLGMINPEGSKRGEAEVILGNALWSRYTDGLKAIRDKAAGRPYDEENILSERELEESKRLAQETLQAGIDRQIQAQKPIDGDFVDAERALAEIYIDTGDPLAALKILEDPNYGLLMLVANDHASTRRQNFDTVVYQAALRAYIAAVPEQATAAESDAMMNRAKQVMVGLRNVVPDPRRLTDFYFSLAHDIKSQLDLEQNVEKKASLARAFEAFLNQIAENSNDKAELLGVADSLLNVGESFDLGPAQPLPPIAAELYEKSVNQCNRILQMQAEGQLELSPEEVTQLRVRLARALRATRQYRLAMNEYDKILTENNGLLTIQIQAAQCYEDWVSSGVGIPWLYVVSTRGGRWNDERQRYTIWGWSGVVNRTANNENYLETFYDAYYHWASCYLKYAQNTDQDDAAEFLDRAAQTIKAVDSQYLTPSLSLSGGEMTTQQLEARDISEQWRPMFNDLMRQVQDAQGLEPTGLDSPKE